MICRGALDRVVLRDVRFSYRLLRRVLLSVRRELRSMKICDGTVSSVAANRALPIRRKQILGKHEPSPPNPLVQVSRQARLQVNHLGRLQVNRLVCLQVNGLVCLHVDRLVRPLFKTRRPERLLDLSRLRLLSGVRTTGRVEWCGRPSRTDRTNV